MSVIALPRLLVTGAVAVAVAGFPVATAPQFVSVASRQNPVIICPGSAKGAPVVLPPPRHKCPPPIR